MCHIKPKGIAGGPFILTFLVVALAATKARISFSDAMVFGALSQGTRDRRCWRRRFLRVDTPQCPGDLTQVAAHIAALRFLVPPRRSHVGAVGGGAPAPRQFAADAWRLMRRPESEPGLLS
jgi:hypothetical protein